MKSHDTRIRYGKNDTWIMVKTSHTILVFTFSIFVFNCNVKIENIIRNLLRCSHCALGRQLFYRHTLRIHRLNSLFVILLTIFCYNNNI